MPNPTDDPRHPGSVHIEHAVIPLIPPALPHAPAQGMVHVPENHRHQWQPQVPGMFDGGPKILVPPIAMGGMKIPPARVAGVNPEARRSVVGKHDQRPLPGGLFDQSPKALGALVHTADAEGRLQVARVGQPGPAGAVGPAHENLHRTQIVKGIPSERDGPKSLTKGFHPGRHAPAEHIPKGRQAIDHLGGEVAQGDRIVVSGDGNGGRAQRRHPAGRLQTRADPMGEKIPDEERAVVALGIEQPRVSFVPGLVDVAHDGQPRHR